MNLDRFVAERSALWQELDSLLGKGRRPEKLGPDGVRRLGSLYRGAAADFALARRRWPGDPVTVRLEDLVARARIAVYNTGVRRSTLAQFFARGYWQRIRERPVPLLIAALLLIVPGLLGAMWAFIDPAAASGYLPPEYRSVIEPREAGESLGLSGAEQAAFSSFIFTNNIQVTFLAFAGGILAGVGTTYVLLLNGALFGTVFGLATQSGNGVPFIELVTAHGVLELSCIVVTAAAGLRLGWALVDPGNRKRSEAVIEEGRRAVEIVLGTMPWLVLAGLIEGFITPSGFGLGPVLVVGFAVGGLYWALLYFRGTPTRA